MSQELLDNKEPLRTLPCVPQGTYYEYCEDGTTEGFTADRADACCVHHLSLVEYGDEPPYIALSAIKGDEKLTGCYTRTSTSRRIPNTRRVNF